MRVLVTGGAGFIGSHLCERLIQDGHRTAILDDLNPFYDPVCKRRNLERVFERGEVRFHEGDIRDAALVSRIMADHRPHAVIHLAACAGVRLSMERPEHYASVNTGGTGVILEAARQHGVERFVFASSSSVYGVRNSEPSREDLEVLTPVSFYASTKLAAEELCRDYSRAHGMNVVCLRLFTVYGPRQRPDLAIHKFASRMMAGLPVPVYGDGSSARDYTYVSDTVEGMIAALRHQTRFDIFNIGNGNPVGMRQLIGTLEEALGVRAEVHLLPEQPGDVPVTCADIRKARELLGYDPRTPFRDGIGKFVGWLRQESAL